MLDLLHLRSAARCSRHEALCRQGDRRLRQWLGGRALGSSESKVFRRIPLALGKEMERSSKLW